MRVDCGDGWAVVGNFGVYVHIPFCASKCDYCAFATWTDRGHLVSSYLEALRTEIAAAVADGMRVADTVFVGGGTPTLVPGDELAEVIASIPVADDAEVTVECNPDDVTVELLSHLSQRRREPGEPGCAVDVGARAAVARPHPRPAQRRAGGRRRSAAAGLAVVQPRRDLRRSRRVDRRLAPRPSRRRWPSTRRTSRPTGSPSRPARRWPSQPDRHPDDDDQADKYELVDDLLAGAGLANYEVSNWARARPRVAAQLPVLEPGRLPGFRVRRALACGRAPVVEPAHP